jgi:hypothetical protein
MKYFYSTQSSDSSNDSAPTFNSGNTEKCSGRKHTDETKDKISDAASKRRHSEATKALLSELNSGSKNPMYGKKHSADTKFFQSSMKGGYLNPMFGKEKHPYFEMMQGTFGAGADNPSYKGTYVLNVEECKQYGPYLKREVLATYKISSRKYYEYLNTNKAYKGFKYSHKP